MSGTLAVKNAAERAFFMPRAKRSGVTTGGSDFRSIELFAPLAAGATQWILISRIRTAAGGANNYYYEILPNKKSNINSKSMVSNPVFPSILFFIFIAI